MQGAAPEEPEMLEHGREPARRLPRPVRIGAGVAVAVLVVVLALATRHPPTRAAVPPPPWPSPSPSAFTATSPGGLVVRYTDRVALIPFNGGAEREQPLPLDRGTGVVDEPDSLLLDSSDGIGRLVPLYPMGRPVTIGPVRALFPSETLGVIWVVGVDGRLRQYDVGSRRYVGSPIQLPLGWQVRAVVGSGAAVLTRPATSGPLEQIAFLGADGAWQPLSTAGRYLVADLSGVVWLAGTCPGSASTCRLQVGFPGGPPLTIAPPPGVSFTAGPAADTDSAGLLVPGRRVADGTPVLVAIGTSSDMGYGPVRVLPGSAGIRLQSGFAISADQLLVFGIPVNRGRDLEVVFPSGWFAPLVVPGLPRLLSVRDSIDPVPTPG